MGAILIIGILLFGLLQLVVGFHGLEIEFGSIWAYIGAGLAFLRFTPPIMVGAYFGAIDLWNVHPAVAVLFAAPMLILLVPGIVGVVVEALRK
jgi:hypothetical protein